MLTPEILEAVKSYAANMRSKVTFVVQTGEHSKRAELLQFLSSLAATSDNLELQERDTGGQLRSAVSFALEVDGEPNGIQFSGIPGGHEFNSLILAILHSSGTEMKLDNQVKRIV
ncbi:MAG: hypothetical protein ACPGSC_11665, partial [Granulosicoccaceae bacterium]